MTEAGNPGVRRRVLLLVACALFMENLDSSILSTALPAIASSLNENPLRLSLAISSYLLSLAVFIPVSGWIADRHGARRVFRSAIVVFTLGSLCCALAPNTLLLVMSRALQGMGGALMVPVGRLVVLRRIPKAEMVSSMVWISVPALIAPIVAPLLGGFIATYASWRWIFLINLPIGALGYVMVSRYITQDDRGAARPMDFAGWWILGTGLTTLVFGAEAAGKDILPGVLTVAFIVTGVAALWVYVHHSRRTPHPVLQLSLLRLATFRASVLGGSLFRVTTGATSFLLPLMLQNGFGMSAAEAGSLTFAIAIGALTMRTGASRIVRRFGFRRVLMIDAVVASSLVASCGLLSAATPRLVMLCLFIAVGLSRSIMLTCVNTMGYADVSEREMSTATSLNGTAQQVAMTVGVAIAAQALHVTALFRGSDLAAATDFPPAFLVIAGTSALSALVYRRLPEDAGNSVSGHRHGA
jgi:EmrB/QacA subfamily drug resistance transporter